MFYAIVLAKVNDDEWKLKAVKVVLYDYPGIKFDGKLYGFEGNKTQHFYNSILHGLLDTDIDGFRDYCHAQIGYAIQRTRSKGRDGEKKFNCTPFPIRANEVFNGSKGGTPFISTPIGFQSPDESPEDFFHHFILRALEFSEICKYDKETFLSKVSVIASNHAGGNDRFLIPNADKPVTLKRGDERFYHRHKDHNKSETQKTKVNVSSFCV